MSGEQSGGLDLSAIIGKLTENPALLSGIAAALKSASPEEAPAQKEAPGAPQIDPDALSKLLPVASMLGGNIGGAGSKGAQNPRCELLRALRPFLSPSRCEAIDYMIKMDGLSGILKGMKK